LKDFQELLLGNIVKSQQNLFPNFTIHVLLPVWNFNETFALLGEPFSNSFFLIGLGVIDPMVTTLFFLILT